MLELMLVKKSLKAFGVVFLLVIVIPFIVKAFGDVSAFALKVTTNSNPNF